MPAACGGTLCCAGSRLVAGGNKSTARATNWAIINSICRRVCARWALQIICARALFLAVSLSPLAAATLRSSCPFAVVVGARDSNTNQHAHGAAATFWSAALRGTVYPVHVRCAHALPAAETRRAEIRCVWSTLRRSIRPYGPLLRDHTERSKRYESRHTHARQSSGAHSRECRQARDSVPWYVGIVCAVAVQFAKSDHTARNFATSV